MLKLIANIIKSFRDRLYAAKDPVGFARSLGVRVGTDVYFYGVNRGMFGSEPWLIHIGDGCHITAGVQFINHDGGTLVLRSECPTLEWTAPIKVGDRVYIGIRSIILPGVTIGSRSIIGAGSVVTRDVPEGTVCAGVPAKMISTTDDYLEKLKAKSLGCGHLKGNDKAAVIRGIYRDKGWFNDFKM